MALRSIQGIPDEIKNVIELFYLRGEAVADEEMRKLRKERPDLNNLIDEVAQLIPVAPESVFMFYDALIAADGLASNLDSDFSFQVSDLMGDASDAPESGFKFSVSGSSKLPAQPVGDSGARSARVTERAPDCEPMLFDFPEMDDDAVGAPGDGESGNAFEEKLNKSLEATTQVPSIFADGSDGRKRDGQSYGLRGRELSSNPEKSSDINLDIDIDFDFFGDDDGEIGPGEADAKGAESASQIRLKNSDLLVEKSSTEYMTPVPNNMQAAQIDKLQEKSRSTGSALPSIMRATQMQQPSEEQAKSQRLAEILRSDISGDNHIRVGCRGNASGHSDSSGFSRPTMPHLEAVAANGGSGLGASRTGESRTSTLYMGSSSFEIEDPASNNKPTCVALNTISPADRFDQGGRGLAALNQIQPVQRVPRLLCKMSELSQKKGINPKAGFILSMIDGNTTIADILDISAWSESETAILLLELEDMGIISLGR